jgi:hypothetical protein
MAAIWTWQRGFVTLETPSNFSQRPFEVKIELTQDWSKPMAYQDQLDPGCRATKKPTMDPT